MDHIQAVLSDADPFESWWPFIIAIGVGALMTLKLIMGGQYCPSDHLISNKIVIITGGNSGIGFEIVKDLCRRGAHVIIACKDLEKGVRVVNIIKKHQIDANVSIRYLDLRSFDCIRRFVRDIEKDFKHINILINNAGLIFHPYEKTVDGFETHLQVNYLGHLLLTLLLVPYLKNASHGRIINVAAHAYSVGKINLSDPLLLETNISGFHARDAFSHSKLAIVIATKCLANHLKDTSVTVNVCTPGLVRSTDHLRRSPIMNTVCAKVITYPWMWLFMKNPKQGAQTIIYLAVAPSLNSVTGEFFNDCDKCHIIDIAKDQNIGKFLLKSSLRAIKISKI